MASVGVGMGKICVSIYCAVHGAVIGATDLWWISAAMPMIWVVGEPSCRSCVTGANEAWACMAYLEVSW